MIGEPHRLLNELIVEKLFIENGTEKSKNCERFLVPDRFSK